ncbi:MAG: hypothetical protein DI628_05975 [Blastochloris viridis]|uniref:Class I SAM-dependent methyltransferase n=1 Tax=Blastochloris viridis TaxID=1079 RepID=A0A6N4RB12_BLAVI|nr:MAG: hypothetical protein DI628_05975 [Blastochloris viridis]
MTALATLLKDRIRTTGPLTVEEYMEVCLYHPQHGYYTNGRNFLPSPTDASQPYPHDFITAAHLLHFAAPLAEWLHKQAQILPTGSHFTYMECGPGSGQLTHDILAYLQKHHPNTYTRAQPVLIEASPTLTELQKQTLHAHPHCQWAATPSETGLPIILIANELLDAFPHSQIIQHEGRLQPRTIELTTTDEFTFTQAEGPITEHSPQMRTWLQTLPQSLHAALFLDYGASTASATGDTFQALHKHQKVSVFHLPGETDLTMHVNFHNVTEALKDSHPHLHAHPLEELAPFLLRHGLASAALSNGMPDSATESALHRLLHPTEMGTLFKVQSFTQTHTE